MQQVIVIRQISRWKFRNQLMKKRKSLLFYLHATDFSIIT